VAERSAAERSVAERSVASLASQESGCVDPPAVLILRLNPVR
jgi:hypothetical protein